MLISLSWMATFPHRQQKKQQQQTNKLKKEEITEMYKNLKAKSK